MDYFFYFWFTDLLGLKLQNFCHFPWTVFDDNDVFIISIFLQIVSKTTSNFIKIVRFFG